MRMHQKLWSGLLRHPFVFVPFVFYIATCSRTIGSGAPAMHTDSVLRGLWDAHVNTHNFTLLNGRLFNLLPIAEIAYRINLVSAVYGALAVVFFYLALYELSRSRLAAFMSSTLLMLSHALWWHSTIFESYSPNAAFVAACLWIWVKLERTREVKYLYALCFTAGLSIFNHVSLGFLCVGVAVTGFLYAFQEKKRILRTLALCAGFAVMGLVPWLVTFFRDYAHMPSLRYALEHAFAGPFSNIMFTAEAQRHVREFFQIIVNNYPHPFILLIPVGLITAWRIGGKKSLMIPGVLTLLLLNASFAFTYNTWNKFSHAQPAILVLWFFGSIAFTQLHHAIEKSNGAALRIAFVSTWMLTLIWTPWMYTRLPYWGEDTRSFWYPMYMDRNAPNAFSLTEYTAKPDKRHFSEYKDYALSLFAKLPPRSIYFDDDGKSYYQLADYYQKYLHLRPDVSIQLLNSFAYDTIGWGITPPQAAAILRRAYYEDRDLFVIGFNFPFSRVMEALPANERFQYTRFDLDERRWIYRLVTQKDEKQNLIRFRDPKIDFTPRRYAGKEATWNISPQDVLFSSASGFEVQDMRRFGTFWEKGDQLFVRSDRQGSWIELQIESDRARRAPMTLNFTRSWDYATVDVYLNETKIVAGLNLFSPVIDGQASVIQAQLEKGKNRLVVQVVGKDPRSTGYYSGLDFIRLGNAN